MRFHLIPLHDDTIQQRVVQQLARHLAASNLLGRVQIVKHAHRKTGRIIPISASSRFRSFDDAGDDDNLYGSFSTDLPNDDAAQYIRDLTPVTREIFDGLTSQYRRDAFTLSATADIRLITKIRDALADVAQKGGTAQDFEAAVRQLTDAYSLGRYEQMSDAATVDVLPVWQYWTVGDERVRPEHAVLDGFAAHAQDSVWHKIYPPNGFNCRCSVISILASEAPKDWNEPGMMRLPELAVLKVPQPGFGKVFSIAA
jgi:SPP1 gp7 family putative phage head morphogenesis protein